MARSNARYRRASEEKAGRQSTNGRSRKKPKKIFGGRIEARRDRPSLPVSDHGCLTASCSLGHRSELKREQEGIHQTRSASQKMPERRQIVLTRNSFSDQGRQINAEPLPLYLAFPDAATITCFGVSPADSNAERNRLSLLSGTWSARTD